MHEREMTMKTAQLIAVALILSASVSAMAQQADTHANSTQIVRGKTRAEVVAELQQAQAEGKDMPTGFVAYDAPAKSSTASGNTTIARK